MVFLKKKWISSINESFNIQNIYLVFSYTHRSSKKDFVTSTGIKNVDIFIWFTSKEENWHPTKYNEFTIIEK